MSDAKFRRLRVLHLVGADGKSAPNPLLLPLLTRGNRQKVESQVLTFTVGDPRFAVIRQSGLPVHEAALSRQRFSPGAFFEAQKLVGEFKPDVIHAWGSTAQALATLLAGGGKKGSIPIVWSVTRTAPLLKTDGWIDKRKFAWNAKRATRCQRIVYSSAVAAANYKRAGLPEDNCIVIAPGVDAERFKPDDAARARVRQQLELPADAVVVGMYAPFAPEADHGTFMKAVGELIKYNSNLYCVMAGRAIVKGNAALSAMIGGGVLGTRTRTVGEWTDLSALFNACDVVCSTATNDAMRLTLAVSMLCGTMCVATSMGSQGEVLGGFGVSAEPGSPDAIARGVRRILEMPVERKAFMAQAARKHILQNFNMTRSIEKYIELYAELVTGEAVAPAAKAPAAEVADPAAQILANRAQATSKNLAKPPPKEEAKEEAKEESLDFGSVKASATPIAPLVVAEPLKPIPAAPSNESIDFSVLTASVPALKIKDPRATEAVEEKPAEPVAPVTDHWTDDDAKLMDEILVEADPETAKLNAKKAEAAAKAAAAKAAANAALTAALAAGGDAAKGINPKLLAAAMSANSGGAARPVAGKPPPPPTTKVAKG